MGFFSNLVNNSTLGTALSTHFVWVRRQLSVIILGVQLKGKCCQFKPNPTHNTNVSNLRQTASMLVQSPVGFLVLCSRCKFWQEVWPIRCLATLVIFDTVFHNSVLHFLFLFSQKQPRVSPLSVCVILLSSFSFSSLYLQPQFNYRKKPLFLSKFT